MIGNLLILYEAPALGLQLVIDGVLIGKELLDDPEMGRLFLGG